MNQQTTIYGHGIIVVHTYDGHLLTIEQSKKILNDPTLSDEQVAEIRDGFRHLAEVIFDKWMEERKALNKEKLLVLKNETPINASTKTTI